MASSPYGKENSSFMGYLVTNARDFLSTYEVFGGLKYDILNGVRCSWYLKGDSWS